MQRFLRTHVCIDEDSMHALNRLRRGTRQPLSRFLTAIVLDYLADRRASHARWRGRRRFRSG